MSLETSLRAAEELYHEAVFTEDHDVCEDRDCQRCKAKLFLKDRLKKNLRTVLCDLIILDKIEECCGSG